MIKKKSNLLILLKYFEKFPVNKVHGEKGGLALTDIEIYIVIILSDIYLYCGILLDIEDLLVPAIFLRLPL